MEGAARYATQGWASSKSRRPPPRHVVPEPPSDGSISVHKIDYPSLGMAEYKSSIGLVIDNLFTEQECRDFLSTTTDGATIESDEKWDVAQIGGGPGLEGVTALDYRNGQRIIKDDFEKADWIFQRIRPYLEDIEEMDMDMTRQWFEDEDEDEDAEPIQTQAKLIRINERLRFLRYTVGGFFKRHQDSQYYTPDGSQRSVYTLQLYLNGSPESLEGGTTRIFSIKEMFTAELDESEPRYSILDVPPRTGRCLIFEQRSILHTGEPVTKGIKVTVRTEFMYGLRNPEENEASRNELQGE